MLAALRQGAAGASRCLLQDAPLSAGSLPHAAAAAAAMRSAGGGAGSLECLTTLFTGRSLPSMAQLQMRRAAFSLPGFDSVLSKQYQERKLLGYSPHQLYSVVAAVEHYAEFVPWCQRSMVLERQGEGYLEAELEVGFQIFVERYLSKVTLHPPNEITSRTGASTLFSHLNSRWQFAPGPIPASVWLTFEVDFAFKSPLYSQVASLFFEEVVQRMMGAFEGRCRVLYGPSSLQRGRPVAVAAASGGGSEGGMPPAAAGTPR